MPRNGSGVYSPPAASYPAVSGTLIESSKRNAVDADIATAITNSIAVNGESVVTNNIPLGGNKLTGVGAATARTDAMTLANAQDGTGVYVATVGGTADVITISPNPSIAAYVAGQEFSFIAGGANTTNVTVNVSALGAKAITKNGTTALVAGDIPSGFLVSIRYDGTRFQLVGSAFSGGTVANATTFSAGVTTTTVTASGDITVATEAYGSGWNASNEVPTKDALYSIMGIRSDYRLTLSGGSLKLSPHNGNFLTINGTIQVIPDAGVSLAATSLTAGFYYIYAYMSGATMTLEASTTARAVSTATDNKGNQIKSGDDSRTLVGAAYSTAAAFSDTAANRLVISWANRKNISGRAWLTANRTTTSTSLAEINSETRISFLVWSDEAVLSNCNGSASNSNAFQPTFMAIGWDGASVYGGVSRQANTTATAINSISATSVASAGQLTEAAIHYVTILGAVGANTGTYIGGADNADRSEINVMIRG